MVLDTDAIAIIAKELKQQKKEVEEMTTSVLSNAELTLRQLYGPVTESAAEKAAKDKEEEEKKEAEDKEEKPEPEAAVSRDKFMASCRDVAKEDGMTDEDAIFTKCDNAWADYLEQQGGKAREAVKSTMEGKDEEDEEEETRKKKK